VPEQQNVPTRARSGVQEWGKGEGTCPNSRMHPQGRVLVFKMEGTCPNSRMSPQGLVLLLETGRGCSRMGGEREHAQTPE